MTDTAVGEDHVFIGRQPIFKANNELYGYELLFRNGFNPNAAVIVGSGAEATAVVINNAMMHFGLDQIVGENKAFINFPESFFLEKTTPCFTDKQIIIEVLEDVSPTETVIESIRHLKAQGYTIALDDFVFRKKLIPFIRLADIIKFDVQYVKQTNVAELFQRVKKISDFKILAERVETPEMFKACVDAGADYFQGYYFAKPEILHGQKVGVGRHNLMLLLQKITDDQMHLEDLEKIIKRDVGLVHKIMKMGEQYRTIGMPKFSSLREVMMLFGLKRVQSWTTLLSMALLDDVMPEVFSLATTRAIFMRAVALETGLRNEESYYLTGLFSLLDVVLKKEMVEALDELPIDDAIKDALLLGQGDHGRLLNLAKTYEKSSRHASAESIKFSKFYVEALNETQAMV